MVIIQLNRHCSSFLTILFDDKYCLNLVSKNFKLVVLFLKRPTSSFLRRLTRTRDQTPSRVISSRATVPHSNWASRSMKVTPSVYSWPFPGNWIGRRKTVTPAGWSPMTEEFRFFLECWKLVSWWQTSMTIPPQFEQSAYHVTVKEDVEVGQSLLNVSAFDADEGVNGKVVYGFAKQTLSSVAGNIFQINSATGEIVIRKGLDYEKESSYLLLVTAKDAGPGSITVYSKVTVSVLDTNDNPPVIRINAVVDVPENQLPGAFVAQFSVDDPDSGQNGKTSCWIFHENFTLQQVFPSVFKIASNVSFDRELADQHHVEIFCRDFGHPSLNVTHDLLVKIADVNDFHPVFTSEQYIINISGDLPHRNSVDQGPGNRFRHRTERSSILPARPIGRSAEDWREHRPNNDRWKLRFRKSNSIRILGGGLRSGNPSQLGHRIRHGEHTGRQRWGSSLLALLLQLWYFREPASGYGDRVRVRLGSRLSALWQVRVLDVEPRKAESTRDVPHWSGFWEDHRDPISGSGAVRCPSDHRGGHRCRVPSIHFHRECHNPRRWQERQRPSDRISSRSRSRFPCFLASAKRSCVCEDLSQGRGPGRECKVDLLHRQRKRGWEVCYQSPEWGALRRRHWAQVGPRGTIPSLDNGQGFWKAWKDGSYNDRGDGEQVCWVEFLR